MCKPVIERHMMRKTDIAIYVHAAMDFEIDEYDITRVGIEKYADDVAERLNLVAKTVGILLQDGWTLEAKASNIEATHPEVANAAEALERITRLGIQDEIVDIGEWDGPTRLNPA
jgi:hypothetical protein